MKIDIMGVSYDLIEHKLADDKRLENCDGYCDWTTRALVVESEMAGNLADMDAYVKKVKRRGMNELQIFSNPEFGQLRTMNIDGAPWVVGKDVASVLGYQNGSRDINRHVDDEDKKTTIVPYYQNGTSVGKITLINESGLYSLILSSKLPSAKRFKHWVTSEVPPAIRQKGAYCTDAHSAGAETQRQFTSDDYIKAATIIASCRNERLPYVLGFLRQGGFSIPEIQGARGEKDDSGECAILINTVVNEHGMSLRAIGRLTGLQATQIQRIRTGASVPTMQRSKIICDAIKRELPESE